MKKYIFMLTVLLLVSTGGLAMAVTFDSVISSTYNNVYVDGTPTADLSATADFDMIGGGLLQLTLTNTGGAAETNPDVLLGLFFDLASGFSLTATSATASSLVQTDGTALGTDVNVDTFWAYKEGLDSVYGLFDAGVAGVGLGIFGPPDLITYMAGQPDGGDYGIVNGFTNPTSVNANKEPYIDNYVTILFQVEGEGAFDPSRDILGVGFQYGTSLGQPAPVPEPSTFLLLGSGLIGLAFYGRKRSKK